MVIEGKGNSIYVAFDLHLASKLRNCTNTEISKLTVMHTRRLKVLLSTFNDSPRTVIFNVFHFMTTNKALKLPFG